MDKILKGIISDKLWAWLPEVVKASIEDALNSKELRALKKHKSYWWLMKKILPKKVRKYEANFLLHQILKAFKIANLDSAAIRVSICGKISKLFGLGDWQPIWLLYPFEDGLEELIVT